VLQAREGGTYEVDLFSSALGDRVERNVSGGPDRFKSVHCLLKGAAEIYNKEHPIDLVVNGTNSEQNG
jgi:hypothetical protein